MGYDWQDGFIEFIGTVLVASGTEGSVVELSSHAYFC